MAPLPGVIATAPVPDAPVVVERGIERVSDWLGMGFRFGGVHVTVGPVLGALLLSIFLLVSATLKQLLHYLLLTTGVLCGLGITMAKMSLFVGALVVGLGFGLQAIFNHFVAGLILLFKRSLKVGDFVELASGVYGHGRDIYIRFAPITSHDDIDILVPNAEFVNGRVVNRTLREVARRQKIPFGVAYGTDKELVKQAALEAATAVPFTLSLDGPRGPQVWLTGFGDSSLDFQLVVWLNADATCRPGAVTAAYYLALHTALGKYGIEIPFPQRDLHVKGGNDLRRAMTPRRYRRLPPRCLAPHMTTMRPVTWLVTSPKSRPVAPFHPHPKTQRQRTDAPAPQKEASHGQHH